MLQTERSECGLACLAAISSFYGAEVSLQTLRQKFFVPSRGLNLKQIREIAAAMNLIGRAIRCELDELNNIATPAILHWGMNHFVVLRKVNKNKFTIWDPALGESKITSSEISEKFTGVALELSPTKEFEKRKERSPLTLFSWFRVSPGMYVPIAQILLVSLFLQAYVIATPFYLQLAIDQGALKGDLDVLSGLALAFGLLAVFNFFATILRGIITTKLTALLNWDMTSRLFQHMLRLPLPWFQRRRLADILSRFDSIVPVRDLISGSLVTVVIDGVLAIATMIMMVIFSKVLAGIVVLGFLIFTTIRMLSVSFTLKLSMDAMLAKIAETGKRIENIKTIQSVKMLGAESARESDWANYFIESIKSQQKLSISNLTFSTTQSFLDNVIRIVLVYIGAQLILEGALTVGVLYAFIAYQGQFSVKASAVLDQFINWRLTDMYSQRLADIVLSSKERHIDAGRHSHELIRGKLQINNLYFSHSNYEAPILRAIYLKINPGDFIAITGPSGSGKSTLLKILCGLYPPTNGTVEIDGVELSSFGLGAYRRALGAVMQDDEIMSGTIAENVAFFDDSLDMEKVWQCLRDSALAADVVAMPMQASTMVGDIGNALSGGQKQRLLLARALYRDPKILILDEATSHLDVEKEREIGSSLKRLNITRIIVAHRQETIETADRVIRLEGGRIVADMLTKKKSVADHVDLELSDI